MTVFIDDMRMLATVGRLTRRWSHLTATTDEELHEFAARLGLKRSWFQGDHYDVTDALRTRALAHGAVPEAAGEDHAGVMQRRRERRAQGLPMKPDGGVPL
jgi:hypothetical protein